jgi:hypothetical protein
MLNDWLFWYIGNDLLTGNLRMGVSINRILNLQERLQPIW